MSLTPTLLLILDGYGLAPAGSGNAARLAHTPNINRLLALPGTTSLTASGRAVGLPAGYMGNSEVGHLNIGAGRIVYQDMTRIDVAIEDGTFATNPVILDLFEAIRGKGGRLHLMGLLSDGGVHSHINHIEALMHLAARHNIPVLLQMFMDGRDTGPTKGAAFLADLLQRIEETRTLYPQTTSDPIRLASLCGRFYAMDRDKRWERVRQAWDLLVHGVDQWPDNQRLTDPAQALQAAYAAGETDEFIKPRLLGDPARLCIQDGDGLFFFNFRADRAREMVSAFRFPDFTGFDRGRVPHLAGLATMTSYDATLKVPVAFSKDNLQQTLGEVIARQDVPQLRIAETEKYAHVTYFFSGGREAPFPLEDRILVDSPKDVATYDLKPEMSVREVTDRFVAAWTAGAATGKYALAVCNFANPDMVGHTGKTDAAIRALEVVDTCVARMVATVLGSGGRVLLTADHGNVEEMVDSEGHPQTSHTCNQVPLVIVETPPHVAFTNDMIRSIPLQDGGKLGDIAPTLLALWNIAQPSDMTGASLVMPASESGSEGACS
ncbi:MAG: 2,3-bisphosphoglycerate-independent phosphoglycerate mutase [Bilophila sp.]